MVEEGEERGGERRKSQPPSPRRGDDKDASTTATYRIENPRRIQISQQVPIAQPPDHTLQLVSLSLFLTLALLSSHLNNDIIILVPQQLTRNVLCCSSERRSDGSHGLIL